MTRQTRTRPSRYCGDSDLSLATPGTKGRWEQRRERNLRKRNRARFLRWFRPLRGKYLKGNGNAFPPTCQKMLTTIFTVARGRINEAGLRRHQLLDRPGESAGSDSCEGRQRNSATFSGKNLDQRNGAGGSPEQ